MNEDARLLAVTEEVKPALFEFKDARAPVLALPPEWTAHNLAQYLPAQKPQNIVATVAAYDNDGFTAYLGRFRVNPLVEAFMSGRVVVATLDYHESGTTTDFAKHMLRRAYEPTRRFLRWQAANTKRMNQVEFASFLEDALADVVDPTQGSLLRLVLQFKAFRNGEISSAVDLQNGDVDLKFLLKTKNEIGGAVLPERIKIRVPIFKGEKTEWDIDARLKYKVSEEAGLQLWFELIQIDEILDQAFEHAIGELRGLVSDTIILRP